MTVGCVFPLCFLNGFRKRTALPELAKVSEQCPRLRVLDEFGHPLCRQLLRKAWYSLDAGAAKLLYVICALLHPEKGPHSVDAADRVQIFLISHVG